jgi:hypothetical protein
MVIQPTVEVNPVIHTPPAKANRWRSDSRQQGPADAQISSGRDTIQAANRDNIKRL